MRASLPLILLLLASTLTTPIIQATDIPRHLDPATLPAENPDPYKLFNLYYNIFNETAAQNFTAANQWLTWASKVEAQSNLESKLQSYYQSTQSYVDIIEDANTQIETIQVMQERLDPTTLQAIKTTSNMLQEATQTLDEIKTLSTELGLILNYPTTQLAKGVEELKQSLKTNYDQLNQVKAEALVTWKQNGGDLTPEEINWVITNYPDLAKGFNVTRPVLNITLDKNEVKPGDTIEVAGTLSTVNGTGIPGRKIIIYFDDKQTENTFTTDTGEIRTNFTVPNIYKQNTTIYAKFIPEDTDTETYGQAVSNIIIVTILWIQPTLTLLVPEEAYPGTELKINGTLKNNQSGLVGVDITVTTLEATLLVETSRDGSFTAAIMVPEEYPEGTQQIIAQSQPQGIYGPASAQITVLITRYPTTLTIKHPEWIFSGQKLTITGNVDIQNNPIQNTLIELRTPAKISKINPNADGTFESEVELPLTLLTSNYELQAFSLSEPWVREASANGSVLVINPITMLIIVGLVGGVSYLGAKRIHIKPRTSKKPPPPKAEIPNSQSLQSPIVQITEPATLKELFWWTATNIVPAFNVTLGKTMTIREWLAQLKSRGINPLYTLIEQVGLRYEKSVYGTPQIEPETKTLFEKIKELIA